MLLRSCLMLLCAGAAAAAPPLQDIFVSGTSTNSWSKGQAVTYRIPSLVTASPLGPPVLLALHCGGGYERSACPAAAAMWYVRTPLTKKAGNGW